ncbi:hypothetical protein MASR1M8_22500 [Thermomonas brevis]
MSATRYLAASLLAIAALYAAWFLRGEHVVAALIVFVSPPLLLAAAAWRGWHRAGFLAAVLALLWFSHAVMLLWSEPGQRAWAAAATVLALVVIHAACLPGIRARRERKAKG